MRKLILLTLLIAVCTPAFAQGTQPPPTHELKKLADGVYASINPDGGPAGSNAGFIIGKDYVAVVDKTLSEASARALLDAIRKITNLPIRFAVNTHYHLDHTGGNV